MSNSLKLFTRRISIFILLSGIVIGFSFKSSQPKFDKRQVIVNIVMTILRNSHYDPQKLDDEFSKKLFDLYLKRLDYNKKFLTQIDVDQLAVYKTELDEQISVGTFEMYDLSVELINKRLLENEQLYKTILSKPFTFEAAEEIETDPEKSKFCADQKELETEWRKSLKYQTLLRLSELMDDMEKIKAAKDTNAVVLPMDSLEAQARRKVYKLNESWFKRLKKYNEKERFSNYLNSIIAMYDPHSEFFPPVEKKKFDQNMSNQLEGIGARLQQKDEYIKVSEIVVGSPSYKQGELKAGDLIIKVAQGNAEPVDIVGMEIDEAIELIKGKKGTEVRLTVKKPDGKIMIIPIIRDIIQLDDALAHSALIEGKKKIGYIKLPAFYADFTRTGAHRCSKDIKSEIDKLTAEGAEKIIIDLRDNGGGSLQEVVEMAGLFIPKGPVVQVRKKHGESDILRDYDASVGFNGPLVIMINKNSASASEILAAAMQDYKRAVIVGNQSFGKGTVQSFIDMDNYLLPQFDTLKPLGAIKVTMQKFYRINGGTTQLKGVEPDIVFPNPYDLLESGEKELDYPLAYDTFRKAEYDYYQQVKIEKLKKSSEDRIQKSKVFQLVNQEAQEIKKRKDDTKYSLKLNEYRSEQKQLKEDNKKYEELRKEIKDFNIKLLTTDVSALSVDTNRLSREKAWVKNLQKDFYLREAAFIAEELK